ncbi:MAG: AEC family transporter [Clostridia bacterium]|nr:AEC family transporter [Clostridia bacterium]
MLESLVVAANAVIPFLFYLMTGYIANHFRLVDEQFLNRVTKLVFQVFFPFTMFSNIYNADPGTAPSLKLILFTVLGILALQALLIAFVPRFVSRQDRRGVFIQAAFRSNLVLFGIPLTQTLFGEARAAVAAMLIAVMVPLFNVTAIVILEMFNGEERSTPAVLLKKIAKNPLLIGCVVGLVFLALGVDLPQSLSKPVTSFANLTTPLALFALGGTLRFKAISKNAGILAAGLSIKLVFAPLFFLALGYLIGLRDIELFLVAAVFATPIASSSYPMAASMGGDGELAGQFVFLSTVLSVLTLFLFIFSMRMFGLI